jgi:hypothetical protein
VNVGFQDENESNACFIYEKYFILSQREKKNRRKDVLCRYALQMKREESERAREKKMIIHLDNNYYQHR